MLRIVSELHGLACHALDGEIGQVDEFLFDDTQWTVRYLIVDTGGWLGGRKVLIAPRLVRGVNWIGHTLDIDLTCEQIRNSPDVRTDEPVSRQWEMEYHDYFAWPYYWGGLDMTGSSWGLEPVGFDPVTGETVTAREKAAEELRSKMDCHLQSTKEVTCYGVTATDGHIGHIKDFVVNDSTWTLEYLAVCTRDWWPGKNVLLPPNKLRKIHWIERTVAVNLTRDQIQNAAEWEHRVPITEEFESQLAQYFERL